MHEGIPDPSSGVVLREESELHAHDLPVDTDTRANLYELDRVALVAVEREAAPDKQDVGAQVASEVDSVARSVLGPAPYQDGSLLPGPIEAAQ